MKIRKITSLTAGLSFVLMVLTSIILYIVPQGRVAYWADWRLWGMSKTDWGNIHINLGFLFLISLGLHVYYNWKPLMSYLKDKTKRMKVFTPEFNAAFIITILVVAGTYLLVPPFSWVMTLNDHFKDTAAVKYGEPPYGHAELSSLKTFAQKMNLELEGSMELLAKAGYEINSPDTTLAAIGKRHGVPPQEIYEVIKGAAAVSPSPGPQGNLPESAPMGTGNLTLADLCARYSLNLKQVVRELKDKGIAVAEDRTLKQIAQDNRTSPTDVYAAIRDIVVN